MIIVAVFDPLALVLILAAQQSLKWAKEKKQENDDLRIDQELEELRRDLELPTAEDEPVTPDPVVVEEPVAVVVPEPPAEPELSQDQIEHVNDLAIQAKEEPEVEYFIIEDADDEDPVDEHPYRGKGTLPSIPMTASYQQPVIKEPDPAIEQEPAPEPEVVPTVITTDERPGDYVEPPVDAPNPRASEAAPARGRGIMHTHLLAEADNAPELDRQARSDFGNLFPINPNKGDTYLRTDYLPNRLFKFNGNKWIQVDKNSTDVYAYEDRYIQHLIEELEAGRYDAEMLTDVEQQQIKNYLERNA